MVFVIGHCCVAEGALLYSLDDGSVFDPTDLAEDVTVEAAHRALQHSMYLKALLLALRLKEAELLEHVLLSTPEDQVRSPTLLTHTQPSCHTVLPYTWRVY